MLESIGRQHPILYERDQIFIIRVSSLWVNFPGYVIFDINHTRGWIFCVVSYIYNEYMSSSVSIIAIIADTMRLRRSHIFLVIETPRSALFFNHVTSSFACPTQNKKISPRHWRIQWIQVSSYSHASPCSHMKSTVFSPKLERDLWRIVVIFKCNKILA